jgi:hypothetical protein
MAACLIVPGVDFLLIIFCPPPHDQLELRSDSETGISQ